MAKELVVLSAGPSIYDVISSHVGDDGRLDANEFALPDDPPRGEDIIRWAPGAEDGVLGGAGGDAAEAKATQTARLLIKASRRPTRLALTRLHRALVDEGVVSFVDKMVGQVVAAHPDPTAVHELGVWLASTSAHRGPVKVGLASSVSPD